MKVVWRTFFTLFVIVGDLDKEAGWDDGVVWCVQYVKILNTVQQVETDDKVFMRRF